MVVYRRERRFIPEPSDLSPSLSTTVSVYRPPWSISPFQTGSVLKPTDPELCRLHRLYMEYEPTEDLCAQLPFDLVGEKRWNLPEVKSHLFHSSRIAGIGEDDRAVRGTSAYWHAYGSSPIADESGLEIGMVRYYLLKDGMWRMEEYTCSEKEDGDCSIIVLRCTNEKLKSLEEAVLLAEYDISYRLQQNCRKDAKKQGVIDYTDDVSGLVNNLGTALIKFNDMRASCIAKEKRLGWGLFSGEAPIVANDAADEVESQFRARVLFVPGPGRKLQGGARVGMTKKKGKGRWRRQ